MDGICKKVADGLEVQREKQQKEFSQALAKSRRQAKQRLVAEKRAAVAEAKERIRLRKGRLAQLQQEKQGAANSVEEAKNQLKIVTEWTAQREGLDPLHVALHQKKCELVAQLFGLLPVFPTINATVRVVNFEIPAEEAYQLMDIDECAAITAYFVKLSSLLGRYLEISLPNAIVSENFRWLIKPRSNSYADLPPAPLHPRIAGMESFKIGMSLLQQNVVRLCFDQGIAIRSGHENEIAQNLFRLVSFADSENKKVGLGWDPPFRGRKILPEDQLNEEDFVMV